MFALLIFSFHALKFFRELDILDQGNYKCKAHNFLGEIEASILMVVEVSEPEGDNYLLLVGGILVAFVVVAIFIVAGTYAKKYRYCSFKNLLFIPF